MSKESKELEKRIDDLNELTRKLKLDFDRFALSTERRISIFMSIYNELLTHPKSQPHQADRTSETTPEPQSKNPLSSSARLDHIVDPG
jgi:hypothetical protein